MHVAICGELGSGCTEVAEILSKMLGVKVINSATVIKSIVTDFRAVDPDESMGEFERHVASGEVDLDKMIAGEIDDILEQGDTIVEGRSAFMLLKKPGVLKVLLVSPLEVRAKHIANTRNITVEEAEDAIRVSDGERQHMVDKMFRSSWLDPHSYDLIINTGLRSHGEAAEQIYEDVKRKQAATS
jgi:cytidylate kinase